MVNSQIETLSIPKRIQDETLNYDKLDKYELTLKSTVKPQLDLDANKEYNAPQTVVFKEKEFNLLYAPIFREIKNRMRCVMSDSVFIYSDLSPDQFANLLTSKLPVKDLKNKKTVEIDFKKFDKCQHSLLFRFECQLYKLFGMPQWMLDIWAQSHQHTTLKCYNAGVKTKVNYQRKSGDPATLLGNTLVSMGMIALTYDFQYGLFVGDDVSLFGVDYVDRNSYITSIFGMESKVFESYSSYFCSKFLLFIEDSVYFIPDPIKLLVKLGRHDLRNLDHVEEYRISTLDLIKGYADPVVAYHLAASVADRYLLNFSIVPLIETLYNIVADSNLFSELYYSYSDDIKYIGQLPDL